jgi:hypothetical protein
MINNIDNNNCLHSNLPSLLKVGYPNNKFSLTMIYNVIGSSVFNSAAHLVNERSHSIILFITVHIILYADAKYNMMAILVTLLDIIETIRR